MTQYHQDALHAAKKVIERVGKKVVLGTPIGIGKPIGFLNALYQLACDDSSIKLTIITALTLTRPKPTQDLEKRLAEPILDRVLGDYVDPIYEADRLNNCVPENIKIIEFFLTPAKYLHNDYAQQHYISTSYTDVLRDCFALSLNVVAQLVAYDKESDCFSLSCSADLYQDAFNGLKAQGLPHAIVVEVNQNLPLMYGSGLIPAQEITDVLQPNHTHHIFALTRDPLSWQDHMIGLYASTLVKDDGCLQMGIGKLSHGVTYALITRHNHNEYYQSLLKDLNIIQKTSRVINQLGGVTSFSKGLYASTEMLCDGYADLLQQQIIKKHVYDHEGLQSLLNSGEITELVTNETINKLRQHDILPEQLTEKDLAFLKHFGIFKNEVTLKDGHLHIGQHQLRNDLSDAKTLDAVNQFCLGEKLINGKVIHAGFFVGSNRFYQMMAQLPREQLNTIDMTSISRTNSLLQAPKLYTLQRQHARFINSCMMVTLGGEIISDTLKDVKELSGVGGQFDFVSMAGKLTGARSIILCRSTKILRGKLQSNILWECTNVTIPRYLRDIIITEYGVADCRSKTDSEVMKAILNITDSRFQQPLLAKAIQANKIEKGYQIPAQFRHNTPEKVRQLIKKSGASQHFITYPFGSDLTNEELVLKKVLTNLKKLNVFQIAWLLVKSSFKSFNSAYAIYLERMSLTKTTNFREWCYQKLILGELHKLNLHKLATASPEANLNF